jgi:hypothetical protein
MRNRGLKLAFIALVLPCLAIAKSPKKVKQLPTVASITMRRTACMGTCPDYSISLKANGMLTYTGYRFVKDSGVYTKLISSKLSAPIMNKVWQYRLDTCSRMYESRIADLPGIYYTITYRDSVKQIFNANFGPEFLETIANDLDNIGLKHDKTWKKTRRTAK